MLLLLITAERLQDKPFQTTLRTNTTRTAEGGPYRRQNGCFSHGQSKELKDFIQQIDAAREFVTGINRRDESPARLIFDPQHPDANRDGMLKCREDDIINEMVDMIIATLYEANVTVVNAAKKHGE